MGRSKGSRLPITPIILMKLKSSSEKLSCREDAMMLWGAFCLCFFEFFRIGEVVVPSDTQNDPKVHLNYQHIKVNDRSHPRCLEVHIKA